MCGCAGACSPLFFQFTFIDNLLVQIHFIIVMIRRTGPTPWKFEFPFPGSLTYAFLPLQPLLGHVRLRRRLLTALSFDLLVLSLPALF